jgi:hypothetical protein
MERQPDAADLLPLETDKFFNLPEKTLSLVLRSKIPGPKKREGSRN